MVSFWPVFAGIASLLQFGLKTILAKNFVIIIIYDKNSLNLIFFIKKRTRKKKITFSERRQLHLVVAEVAFTAAVAHANVRVLVTQSFIRRGLKLLL